MERRVAQKWLRQTSWLFALAFSACRPDELFCTAVGDSTGLTVELSATPDGPFTVDIVIPRSTPSTPVSYTYRCDGGQLCRGRFVDFPGLIATDFTVRVTTNRGVRETPPPLPVRYTDTYPNGKSCAPRSTTARVQADIPE